MSVSLTSVKLLRTARFLQGYKLRKEACLVCTEVQCKGSL